METEKEFSFRSYFVYAMRKWIILVLCVLIGAGAGVYYSMSYKATNIVMYEGTISFDVAEYGSLYYPGELSDGTYSICEAKGRSIMDVASIPKLKSDVYDAVKTRIYPNEKSESAKIQKFLTNLKITRDSNFAVRVDFAYDITRDEDKEAAYNVVYTYINLAKLDIYAANPGLKEKNAAAIASGTGGKVIIESPIGVNYDTAVFGDLTQSNKKPSLVTSPLIGGVGGLVAAAVIITLMYAFDKRIKRLQYIVEEEDSRVFSAGADPYDNGSLVKLSTAVTAENLSALLVTSVAPDEEAGKYAAAFAGALESTGKKVRLVEFGEGKENWRKYFAGEKEEGVFEVFTFDCSEKGALGFIASKAGNACLVVNQALIRAKDFSAAVDEVKAAGAKYFGTVLYNVTDSYTG